MNEYELISEKTAYKPAKGALPETEILYKDLMDLARDVIFSLTPQGLVGSLNQAFWKITGWQTQEWIGKPFTDLLHPEDIPLAAERFSSIMKGHVDQAIELRLRKKSGDYVYAEVLASPRKEKRMITGILGIGRDITERKQVEEMLQKSELKYRSLIEQAPDIIFIVDAEGNLLHVNQTGQKMLGYSEDELHKMKTIDTYPTDEMKVGHRRLEEFRAMRAGGKMFFERLMRRKDGSLFPVEINVGALEDGTAHAIIRDITERKHAEEALRESEVRYRELFNNISSGVAIYEVRDNGNDFIFRDFNRAGERIDGDRKEDIIGKSIFEVRPGINKFGLLEVFRRVFATGIPEHYPARFYIDEKLKGWYNNFIYRLPSGEIVTVYDDITERKQSEEKLRKSEEKWRKLVTTIPDYIALHDLQGRYVFLNHYAEGFSEEDVVGKSLYDFISEDSKEEYRRNFNKCLNTKQTQRFIYTALGNNRAFRIYQSYLVPITQKDQIVNVMSIATDITESKQVEEALKQEKENFRHSLDDSPLGVRIATIEGKTIYANKTILDFYGYESLGELQKTPLKDRYNPESYAQAQKRKYERKYGDLSTTDYEISIVRKNGEILHLQVYRNEVLWNGAKQFQVFYKDITKRKQAEEKFRDSKELLEKLNQHLLEVRENERAVISREIHDELGQSLTALKLDLNMMHTCLDNNPEAVTKLKGMIELVSDTIKNVQRISSDLRPGILDELGLISAIEWYCDEFEKRTGIKCKLKLDNSDLEDSKINLTFFRVLQETLTNVIRHAKASSVSIKLHQLKKGVTLTIRDNGIGIPEEKIRSTKSFGLISMRERVKQFNGTVNISSKKDNGTKLVIYIPS